MLSTTHIFDRIYAGFLGKAIGVRLGAPVEPTIWSYERIRDTYGEVTRYLRDFKNFAADDTNGPVYFIRALRDYGLGATRRTWADVAQLRGGRARHVLVGRVRRFDRAHRLPEPAGRIRRRCQAPSPPTARRSPSRSAGRFHR